jgi:hypothetical protein
MCQAFPVAHLDRALGALFLEAVRPAAIETTLAALAVLERERQALDRHWRLRIERARYEAQRAQRQYDAIEPENRLVARALEARWNAALQALEQLEREYAVVRRTELLPLGEADATPCGAWPRTCPRSGTPRPRPTWTASACCGWW